MSNGILFAIPIDFHFPKFKLLKSEREKMTFAPHSVQRSLRIVKEFKILKRLFHNFQVNRKKTC